MQWALGVGRLHGFFLLRFHVLQALLVLVCVDVCIEFDHWELFLKRAVAQLLSHHSLLLHVLVFTFR